MNNPTDPTTLIFLHIPKTAGTTLRSILRQQYPPEVTYNYYHDPEKAAFHELTASQKQRYRLLCGHMNYGIHQHLPGDSRYITILRDPVARVISYYNHVRRRGDIEQGLPLTQFVEQGLGKDNRQTLSLAGDGADDPLQTAKDHLDACALAGITERFDESIILLKHLLGWRRSPYYVKKLVSSKSISRATLPEDTLHLIEAHNQHDIALYAYANQKFSAHLAAQEPAFHREVKAFQRWNHVYSTPYKTGRYVIRKLRNRL